ncbi:MAG: glycosyltransferase family 4 protein [Candidatus Micrarchaeota archaeon]
MRICMIVEDCPPGGGGGGFFVKELAERLSKKNKIIVVTRGEYDSDETEGNIIIRRMSGSRISFIARAVHHLIKAPTCDIYHAHGVFAGLIAKKVQLFKHKPVILHVHGFRSREISGIFKYELQKMITKLNFAKIISVDEESTRKMRDLGVKNVVTIPVGIDRDMFRPDPKARKTGKRFLFVGRLEEVKNIWTLLKAFESLYSHGTRIELWIAGSGGMENELKNYCRGRSEYLQTVKFLGNVEKEELPKIYSQCDFFVLPSFSEGMPLTLLEAMASGLPFIVSDIPSLSAIANGSKGGIIFETRDPKDLAEKMKQMIKGKNRLGPNGREYVEKKFSWEKTVRQIEKVYAEVEA